MSNLSKCQTGRYLTTGQAALVLRCSQKHVSQLIDRGLLRGFRMPGSRHRRIVRADLDAFQNRHLPQEN